MRIHGNGTKTYRYPLRFMRARDFFLGNMLHLRQRSLGTRPFKEFKPHLQTEQSKESGGPTHFQAD